MKTVTAFVGSARQLRGLEPSGSGDAARVEDRDLGKP